MRIIDICIYRLELMIDLITYGNNLLRNAIYYKNRFIERGKNQLNTSVQESDYIKLSCNSGLDL